MSSFTIVEYEKRPACGNCNQGVISVKIIVIPSKVTVSISMAGCLTDDEYDETKEIELDGESKWINKLRRIIPNYLDKENIIGRIQCYTNIVDIITARGIPSWLCREEEEDKD